MLYFTVVTLIKTMREGGYFRVAVVILNILKNQGKEVKKKFEGLFNYGLIKKKSGKCKTLPEQHQFSRDEEKHCYEPISS